MKGLWFKKKEAWFNFDHIFFCYSLNDHLYSVQSYINYCEDQQVSKRILEWDIFIVDQTGFGYNQQIR